MKTALLPHYSLVADVQPNAGPAWVRLQLADGTLLPCAELTGCSDHRVAYANLFAASIDLHARLKECAEMLMGAACQASDTLHKNQRDNMRRKALECYDALRKAEGDE